MDVFCVNFSVICMHQGTPFPTSPQAMIHIRLANTLIVKFSDEFIYPSYDNYEQAGAINRGCYITLASSHSANDNTSAWMLAHLRDRETLQKDFSPLKAHNRSPLYPSQSKASLLLPQQCRYSKSNTMALHRMPMINCCCNSSQHDGALDGGEVHYLVSQLPL